MPPPASPIPGRSGSLIGRTLARVGVRIGLVVAVASVLSYWHVRSSLETQALQQLSTYVEERRARESAIFVLAEEHLHTFAQHYRVEYQASFASLSEPALEARFDALFETRADGSLRLAKAIFDRHGITGAIGRYVAVDADLKRRLVVAFDILVRFGPAWRGRFVNLFVITPEHAVLMYWPDQPWALTAADWEIAGKLSLVSPARDGVVVTGESSDGSGRGLWSSLYFDYGVNDWLVSATEPVDLANRPLLFAGHDILLKELLQRALTSDIEGTFNLMLSEDGRLIAHPRLMEAIQANGGSLAIAETGDPRLIRLFELIRTRAPGQVVVENGADDEYLAVTPLEGPGWWLITVFPRAIVAEKAWAAARIILLLGAAALLVEIAVLYVVLKRQVAQPLQKLVEASRRVASGRVRGSVLDDGQNNRDDELGELGHAFDRMVQQVEARETALTERSKALAMLNERLEHELADRRQMEATMARQREELHQSEKIRALGSLLAGIAHELNNPLAVVVGRSELLAEKLHGTPEAVAAEKLRTAAERCAKIVRTFLAMARQQAPARQPVNLSEVVDGALDLLASRLRSNGVTIANHLPWDLPPILGDAGQLGQVFGNLIINAEQAMAEHPGERLICIEGHPEDGGKAVIVAVSDTGPGIPPAIRHRIFEPFFTTKPAGIGTGMGLSVCYRIIELHGGTMRVETPAGGGAMFVMRLPLSPPAAA